MAIVQIWSARRSSGYVILERMSHDDKREPMQETRFSKDQLAMVWL